MLLTIRTAWRETQGRSLANYLCVYHIIRSTIVKSLYSNLHMRPSRQLSLLLCITKKMCLEHIVHFKEFFFRNLGFISSPFRKR